MVVTAKTAATGFPVQIARACALVPVYPVADPRRRAKCTNTNYTRRRGRTGPTSTYDRFPLTRADELAS